MFLLFVTMVEQFLMLSHSFLFTFLELQELSHSTSKKCVPPIMRAVVKNGPGGVVIAP